MRQPAPSTRVPVLFTDIVPRPNGPPSSATAAGGSCSASTTTWAAAWSSRGGRVVEDDRRRALLPPSTAGAGDRLRGRLRDHCRRRRPPSGPGCAPKAGESELREDDVGGIAVHLAARILAEADPGEVVVSRTVRDLVAGSDRTLAGRGTHQLKGRGRLAAVRGGRRLTPPPGSWP